jgi:hypothetical protein
MLLIQYYLVPMYDNNIVITIERGRLIRTMEVPFALDKKYILLISFSLCFSLMCVNAKVHLT